MLNKELLPVEIVLTPSWWYKNTKLTFDRDYFFHPLRRVEAERMMEKVLYEHWGQFGLGAGRNEDRPEVGPVHLAAGYLLSEMLGCHVEYTESAPPKVWPAHIENLKIDEEAAFQSDAFKTFFLMMETMKGKYGWLCGDVNWSGILNLALDLKGEDIFLDMRMDPDEVDEIFQGIANVIQRFTTVVQQQTGTSSISVNRMVANFQKPVFLHSECSHTMISAEHYERFLLPFDILWSQQRQPFGIHFCGNAPHRFAKSFQKIPKLDFLDVGWGGDVKLLRQHLPDTFLNIRLSPVEIIDQTPDQIKTIIRRLVTDSGDPYLTGICCINMDHQVNHKNISTIFETAETLRKEYRAGMS